MANLTNFVLLFFYFCCSKAQNTASLLADIDFFPTKDEINRDVTRENAGFHISNDSMFILVVNERATLNPNGDFNNIVLYVLQQDYTILGTKNVVSTKPRTVAYESGIDNSNNVYVFGSSTDLTDCPPINSGTGTTGFIMKFSSPSSSVATWCSTTVGLSFVIRMIN